MFHCKYFRYFTNNIKLPLIYLRFKYVYATVFAFISVIFIISGRDVFPLRIFSLSLTGKTLFLSIIYETLICWKQFIMIRPIQKCHTEVSNDVIIWHEIKMELNIHISACIPYHNYILYNYAHGRCSRLVERRGDRMFHSNSLDYAYRVRHLELGFRNLQRPSLLFYFVYKPLHRKPHYLLQKCT